MTQEITVVLGGNPNMEAIDGDCFHCGRGYHYCWSCAGGSIGPNYEDGAEFPTGKDTEAMRFGFCSFRCLMKHFDKLPAHYW